tara:strand:+ start:5890 stop:6807 length:918 start_codon:yes stop_codon:yes gene_type:complete
MSRIERGRVEPGETTDATTLNNTYADYTQGSALNTSNTRDQAFDIAHFADSGGPIKYAGQTQLGNDSLPTQASPVVTTVSSASSSAPATPHIVQTSAGSATFLNLSSTAWSVTSGDVLRVWWHLNCKPKYSGTPWTASGVKGKIEILPTSGSTNVEITDSMHCWVAYLQWEKTSSSLANWQDVPGQDDFLTAIDSQVGSKLADTSSTTVIPAWLVAGDATASGGKISSTGAAIILGYNAAYGMFAYDVVTNATIYGLRVVIRGLMHPQHDSSGSPYANLLVYDLNAVGTLDYNGGRLNALVMREK